LDLRTEALALVVGRQICDEKKMVFGLQGGQGSIFAATLPDLEEKLLQIDANITVTGARRVRN
jgi:hypothetical protein